MQKNKALGNAVILFSGLFFAGIFVFYAFFYNSHLHFEEQFQLHLMTWDWLLTRLSLPGGFAGYLGSFLTQFYFVSLAGPVVIVLLLATLTIVVKKIFSKVNSTAALFPFTFIPALLSAMILCNEFYPLSAITSFLIAMTGAMTYVSVTRRDRRAIAGSVLIPVTYWLAGGAFISLVLIMIVYELILRMRSSGTRSVTGDIPGLKPISFWYFVVYVVLGLAVPLVVRQYLVMQPLMITFLSEFYYKVRTTIPTAVIVLFILPPVIMLILYTVRVKENRVTLAAAAAILVFAAIGFLGFRNFANFSAEEIMRYDYLVRSRRWDDAVKYAERNPPRNFLSLSMLNLSLAKSGQMGSRMFSFPQRGDNGLFIPFNKEYVAPMMGNEILYNLGFVNAAQEYVFESMETIPDMGKSARALQRLAETNLINGEYRVAGKYIDLLGKTIFYRKWARNARNYLNNEDKIDKDPDWGEKRKFAITEDYFFSIKNIEASLAMMVKAHPDNKTAFEYLMAFYLINKDLRNVLYLVPVMEKMNYREVPVAYQEALMYVLGLNSNDPMKNAPPYISQATKERMQAYAGIYTSYQDAETRLKKNFSGTYWYYLHFGKLVRSDDSEKK
jgi:hypothetical protein